MRPLRYSINVTVDGCCDHRAIAAGEELHRHAVENLVQADALLFGRVTYEMMEAAWRRPAAAGARPDWMEPFARTINAAKKYVVSSTLDRVDWNAELVRGDLGKAVQQLKQEPGNGLFAGGVKLPLALAELGLIDESPSLSVTSPHCARSRDDGDMFDVLLHQPEIPPNTGNVIRLCANTGARLHLIEPLGFSLEDKQLRRAGLDYHEYATLQVHPSLDAALHAIAQAQGAAPRLFALSTRGTVRHDAPAYRAGDAFLFGAETRGLPADVLDAIPPAQRLRLPMRPGNRSLNLSNAVAVVVFEAWRQSGFAGGA